MSMSRQASRLVGHSGAVAPDASRHRLFSAGGRRQEPAEHRLPWPPATTRPVVCRRCAAFAAVPATAGSRTAGQSRPPWKEPWNDSPDLLRQDRGAAGLLVH